MHYLYLWLKPCDFSGKKYFHGINEGLLSFVMHFMVVS